MYEFPHKMPKKIQTEDLRKSRTIGEISKFREAGAYYAVSLLEKKKQKKHL